MAISRSSSSKTAAAASAASSGPLSTADLVHRLPPALLRVLVSFAPLIELTHAFLLLATWSTPYPHHSFLLVVGYALAVIVAYPLLRFAPQALVLAYVTYAWLGNLRPSAGAAGGSAGVGSVSRVSGTRETNAAKLNKLVLQLDDIADFVSSARRSLVTPALALLSWSENPTRTKRLVIFLLTTYPLYLACYFPWASLGLPTLQLDVLLPWSSLSRAHSHAYTRALHGIRFGAARLFDKTPAGVQSQLLALSSNPHLTKAKVMYDAHVGPRVVRSLGVLGRASHSLAVRYVPSRLSFQVLPPFPLASLSVRSTVLTLGLLALTWCAPWAALIRSVLWRSALVRRIVLGLVRLLSGEKGPLSAFGRGHESTLDPLTGESIFSSSLIPDLVGGAGAKKAKDGVVKHEDVVYEFSVYENQRWWMGLDWTSALLPQERPSWSDEHHNAVSPPSSFSLPPPKVTTTPQDTPNKAEVGSATPSKFTKRTVTWKWLDPEWTVAGAGYVGSIGYQPPGAATLPTDAAALSRSPSLGSDSEGFPGSPTSASSAGAGAGGPGALIGGAHDAASRNLDVDGEGWSYGDNLWEKMSGKSGRGRYTRRRRWVRRAVLEIKVERDVSA
ncbi:hypothetical protein OC835_001777 [Tilletia horrida]|nr:hypothetical protein OC835_001777 [Tilletia horrida]